MSQSQITHTIQPETPSLPEVPIRTSEPTIAIPTDIQPTIPPQYWGTTGFILVLAILIRSTALLIQVLTPLILKQKSASKK